MVLTPIQDNQGLWYMTGITPQNTPFLMGRRMFNPGNGPHYIGFDDNFTEPVIFKAFYDPSRDVLPPVGYDFVGYMQSAQVNFLAAAPVPPQAYGGMLADRATYATGSNYGYRFIDFMGPADARLREFSEPFYAYNGALLDGTLRTFRDFQYHPLPNGSLYYPTTSPANNQSLCASLFGEVSTSLLTAQDITPLLSDANLLYSLPVTAMQLAQQEAYQLALQYLMDSTDTLTGLQLSDVAGQVISEYVLLTLPNYEEMQPRLCVSTHTTSGQVYVDIHLLEYGDIVSLETDATLKAFMGFYEFLEGAGVVTPDVMQVGNAPVARGQGGLLANPYNALTPADFCVEVKYWTTALAHRSIETRATPRFRPLSTFTWSALFQYDDDTRSLALSTIREPEIVPNYDWVQPYITYRLAYSDPNNTAPIDTSNFTKAAMRRDNLGAGVKLNFIRGNGTML